jgi:tetratricopeptide (TPR) repeat protein
LNAYYRSDYTAAAGLLETLPATYDVLVDHGAALASSGDVSAAFQLWKRAAEKEPFESEAFFNMGYWSLVRGDTATAVRNLELFQKLEGRDSEGLFLLFRAYERAGRAADSQRALAEARGLSSKVEKWLAEPLPGFQRLRSGINPTEIRFPITETLWNDARLARRASGEDVVAVLDSVRGRIESELYGDAIRQLQQLLKVFPNSPDTRLLLGQVYQLQGSYDLAVREYQASARLKPSAVSYLLLARGYRSLNQIPEALLAVGEALKLEPKDIAAATLRTELQRLSNSRGRRP